MEFYFYEYNIFYGHYHLGKIFTKFNDWKEFEVGMGKRKKKVKRIGNM